MKLFLITALTIPLSTFGMHRVTTVSFLTTYKKTSVPTRSFAQETPFAWAYRAIAEDACKKLRKAYFEREHCKYWKSNDEYCLKSKDECICTLQIKKNEISDSEIVARASAFANKNGKGLSK